MMCERVLRVLSQRNTCVPIWSCRKSESLVSVRFAPPTRSLTWQRNLNQTQLPHQTNPPHHHPLLLGGSRAAPLFSCASSKLLLPLSSSSTSSISSSSSATSSSTSSSSSSSSSSLPPSAANAAIPTSKSSSSSSPSSTVTVDISHGLPQITVPLPSRNEPCVFTLKPVTHTIGDFLSMLKIEDAGIDRAVIRTSEGIRMSSTTSIQTLMQNDFDLLVNDTTFRVNPPKQDAGLGLSGMSTEEISRLGDVRALVGQLYEALHVEEHQAAQEQRLISEMEALQEELTPLEKQRDELNLIAERKANQMTWLGLGMMSVQFGILARLTWWEYSWDIMEPVTYFVTYGTAMACYAYFVLTKQDYILPDVQKRQYLLSFHKCAKKDFWDVSKYNSLKEGLHTLERDLKRLRDPLHLRLPPSLVAKGANLKKDGILGSQVTIGNLKDMIKSKLS